MTKGLDMFGVGLFCGARGDGLTPAAASSLVTFSGSFPANIPLVVKTTPLTQGFSLPLQTDSW